MKCRINKRSLLFFAGIIAAAILIRISVGEPCRVPSESMEPTIRTGEWLWINKITYGGLLPERWADIPLINVFTHIAFLREADEKNNWGYHRLPGFQKPRIGDIVVFRSPENSDMLLVKRITEIVEKEQTYYYLQGDNSENSRDSRFFSYVPENLIIGKINK